MKLSQKEKDRRLKTRVKHKKGRLVKRLKNTKWCYRPDRDWTPPAEFSTIDEALDFCKGV